MASLIARGPRGSSSVTPKKIAVYCRVSTIEQTTDMQVDGLREFAAQRGWTIVREFVDVGISGAKDRRPQLDEMMRDARRRKFAAVVVWKFDRFARSVRHLVTALDEFRELGIDFVSLHDAIDTSTATGRFTFAIVAAVAEFEREIIRGRVKSGLDAARRRGRRIGRPKVRVDLDRALELRAEGKSIAAVAKLLGVGVGTLHAALRALRESPPETADGGG